MKSIAVEYYSLLREQAGKARETLQTQAGTPAELYSELRARYGFSLQRDRLRVAVDEEFCDWDRALVDGATVVFIPPVAGG